MGKSRFCSSRITGPTRGTIELVAVSMLIESLRRNPTAELAPPSCSTGLECRDGDFDPRAGWESVEYIALRTYVDEACQGLVPNRRHPNATPSLTFLQSSLLPCTGTLECGPSIRAVPGTPNCNNSILAYGQYSGEVAHSTPLHDYNTERQYLRIDFVSPMPRN